LIGAKWPVPDLVKDMIRDPRLFGELTPKYGLQAPGPAEKVNSWRNF
jgi:hypothetical protein